MSNKNHKKGMLIFKRFMISYLFILIIPLLIGIVAYHEAVRVVEENARDVRLSIMKHSMDIIDKNLREVDEMVVQMAMDPILTSLLHIPKPEEGSPAICKVMEASKRLQSYKVINSFKTNYYIFFNESELVLSHNRTNMSFAFHYRYFMNYDHMDYSEWYDRVLRQPHIKDFLPAMSMTVNEKPCTMITYIQSIPLSFSNQPQGAIVFLIDEKEIQRLLKDVNIGNSGWVYIVDQKGQIMSGITHGEDLPKIDIVPEQNSGYFHQRIQGEDMMITYTTSKYNGWKYVSVLPTRVVMLKVSYIQTITLAIAVVSLLIGALISYFLAYRNTKPFKDMVFMLRDFFKGEGDKESNEYDYLQGGIQRLMENNRNLRHAFQNQVSILKTTFLDRLFKGEFNGEKDMKALLDHVGIQIEGKSFGVVILNINRYEDVINKEILEELDMFRIVIDEMLRKHDQERVYLHILGANEIGLLISFTSENQEDWIKKIEEIVVEVNQELSRNYGIHMIFGIGGFYGQLQEVHKSFREARKAINYCRELRSNQQVVWYAEMPKENKGYYYPLDLEVQLVNMVKTGNKEEIERILRSVYRENFVKQSLTKEMENHLMYSMRGTLLRIVNEILILEGQEEMISQFYSDRQDVDQTFDWIRSCYNKICDTIEKGKKSHNAELLERILDYIQSSYMDGDLTAYGIASQFNISESYFSQFFKEQMGENYSSYLEKLRIQNACELLANTQTSIKDIAKMVGYNNPHTFRRAFKRIIGVVPTQYR